MTQEQKAIIEGAYLMGFEPSSDNLTAEALFTEAQAFMSELFIF